MRVLLEFRHFFNSKSSSTYFKDSCISLQKILIDEMSLSDCIIIGSPGLNKWTFTTCK